MNDEVIKYIRANRDAYTREAINQVLLDAGHSPEDIAAGWQEIEEEDERFRAEMEVQLRSAADELDTRKGGGRLGALLVLVLFIGIILVTLTNLGLGLSYFPPESRGVRDAAILAVNLGSLIAGLALFIAAVVLLNRNWPVGKVSAVVAVTALIWFMIVLGTCLYTPQAVR